MKISKNENEKIKKVDEDFSERASEILKTVLIFSVKCDHSDFKLYNKLISESLYNTKDYESKRT